MVICLDKDTLSCVTCGRKIERALWLIWIKLEISGEFCDVGLSCIVYTRKSWLPVRYWIFRTFPKREISPEVFNMVFRNNSSKGIFGEIMSDSKKLKLSGDSRWLQEVAPKKIRHSGKQCQKPPRSQHVLLCVLCSAFAMRGIQQEKKTFYFKVD